MRIRLLIFGSILGAGLILSQCTSVGPPKKQAPPYEEIKSLYAQEEYQTVLDTVQTLEATFPEESMLYYYAGLAQLQLGDVQSGIKSYQDASAIQENAHMDSLYGAIMEKQASRLYRENHFQAANNLADQIITIDKTNRGAYYIRYMIKGRNLLDKGSKWQLWDAVVAFGNAAQMAPDDPMPHYYMAKAYYKKDDQDFDNIIEQYDKTLALNPPSNLVPGIKKELRDLQRRKKLYQDFWGK